MTETNSPFRKINWSRFFRGTHFLNFEQLQPDWFYFFATRTRASEFCSGSIPRVSFLELQGWLKSLLKLSDWTQVEARKTQCSWISFSGQIRLLYFWTQAHCDGFYLIESPQQCLAFGQRASCYYLASSNFEYLAAETTANSLAFIDPPLEVVLSALVDQFESLDSIAN
jgi:hypothetical protein